MDRTKMKIVYNITTRGERKFWNRVGVAFVNRDGSLNVKLDAVPTDGELQIRDMLPPEERARRREERAALQSAEPGHSNRVAEATAS